MRRHTVHLGHFFASIIEHRDLIQRLAAREFGQRFRGSTLGLGWAVLTPLLTAAIFTFVFSSIFQARWGVAGPSGPFDFAVIFLAGLAVHTIFAESLNRAPILVVGNAGYVTKVVFPLEILPVVSLVSALANAAIWLAVVMLGNLIFNGVIQLTSLLLPLVLLPYLIFIVALGLLVAACGVFIRDLSQVVGLLVTASMFLTPIFYPIQAVPPRFQTLMWLNPLTFVVEQVRAVLIFGRWPDFGGLALYSIAALAFLAVAFWVFQRLRPGFADVL